MEYTQLSYGTPIAPSAVSLTPTHKPSILAASRFLTEVGQPGTVTIGAYAPTMGGLSQPMLRGPAFGAAMESSAPTSMSSYAQPTGTLLTMRPQASA